MDVKHEPVAGVEVVLSILEIGCGLAPRCAELAVRMRGSTEPSSVSSGKV